MGAFARLGNELYSGKRSIDFVGRRILWYTLSAVIVLAAVAGLGFKGLNWGIEFTGGAEFRVSVAQGEATQDLADSLTDAVTGTGIDSASSPVVTTSGDKAVLVQTEPLTEEESVTISDAITEAAGVDSDALSQSEIGASWGQEVAQRSLIGLLVFLVLVVLFIWAYFREWKMSVAALVALAHDVLITIGVYALSGFEVTPATVTGVLTILGFSLYDTVVVFDKVRENTKHLGRTHQTYADAANLAVNQTLVRSINTSIVALIPVGALLWVGAVQLGSGPLKDLALALFVGMAAGAYSSIFIATPLLVQLKARERRISENDRRARARQRRAAADPYGSVPAYADDMPLADEPGAPPSGRPRPAATATAPKAPKTYQRPPSTPGSGRAVPKAHGPVGQSPSSGRVQPSRKPRSQRGKK